MNELNTTANLTIGERSDIDIHLISSLDDTALSGTAETELTAPTTKRTMTAAEERSISQSN